MKIEKLISAVGLTTVTAGLGCANASDESLGGFMIHHIANNYKEWPFIAGTKFNIEGLQMVVGGVNVGLSLHVIMMLIAFVLLLILLPKSAKRKSDIPLGRFGHSIEAIVQYFKDEVIEPNLGKEHGKKWLPFLMTLFFFILMLNLIGLIPGFAAVTANINFTATLAVLVFILFNVSGMINNGPISYIKHLAPGGIPMVLLPVIFIMEVIGMFTKSIALAIRLAANMTAGHMLIMSFLGLIIVFKTYFVAVGSVPFSLFMYCLETFVAFLQAFVFTLLTTLYIGMAVHQDH
jgi:F-type H+-transporting ATPase subunit a